MAFDRSKFVKRFIEEARENHSKAVSGLLLLEKDSLNENVIAEVFRSIHTVKGASRMLGLKTLTGFLHTFEDVLSAMRSQKLVFNPALANILLAACDEFERLIDLLVNKQELTVNESIESGLRQSLENIEASVESPKAINMEPESLPAKPVPASDTVRIKRSRVDEVMKLTGEQWNHLEMIKARLMSLRELNHTLSSLRTQCRAVGDDEQGIAIRQQVESLSKRLKTVINHLKNDIEIQEIKTADLQTGAHRLGLIPLSRTFEPLRRIARDAAANLGKEVELVITGEDTELDRRMLELIQAPLEHMIRNAIVHGIESPDQRQAAGKKRVGRIEITASFDQGRVMIRFEDDGTGIDLEGLGKKATKLGLVEDKDWHQMTEQQRTEFIFAPGLSSSEIVTDWSGRGVGMDVVRRNIIHELNGSIDVDHSSGQGTRFRIRLPQSLAVIQLMAIKSGEHRLGIPTNGIRSIHRLDRRSFINAVDYEAVSLGDDIVRILDLAHLFGSSPSTDEKPILVVVTSNSRLLAVIVDKVEDIDSVVVHPIPEHINAQGLLMGAAIRGEGSLMNILNIPVLIQMTEHTFTARPQTSLTRRSRILVVDDSFNTREIEKSILESHGYQVNLAADGREAFDLLIQGEFDLVVSDVEMPHMNGFELTRKIKETDALMDIPVILLTARASNEDRLKGIDSGASAYLVKHAFEQTSLIETIENLIP